MSLRAPEQTQRVEEQTKQALLRGFVPVNNKVICKLVAAQRPHPPIRVLQTDHALLEAIRDVLLSVGGNSEPPLFTDRSPRNRADGLLCNPTLT